MLQNVNIHVGYFYFRSSAAPGLQQGNSDRPCKISKTQVICTVRLYTYVDMRCMQNIFKSRPMSKWSERSAPQGKEHCSTKKVNGTCYLTVPNTWNCMQQMAHNPRKRTRHTVHREDRKTHHKPTQGFKTAFSSKCCPSPDEVDDFINIRLIPRSAFLVPAVCRMPCVEVLKLRSQGHAGKGYRVGQIVSQVVSTGTLLNPSLRCTGCTIHASLHALNTP